MKKFNNYTYLGLIFNSFWLISNRFNLFPDFIEGLCVGIGLTFILIGIYAENHDTSAVKNFKKSFLKKVFGR